MLAVPSNLHGRWHIWRQQYQPVGAMEEGLFVGATIRQPEECLCKLWNNYFNWVQCVCKCAINHPISLTLWLPYQAVPSLLGCILLGFQHRLLFCFVFFILTIASPMHPIKQMQVQPHAERGCHHAFRGAPMTAPRSLLAVSLCKPALGTAHSVSMTFCYCFSSPSHSPSPAQVLNCICSPTKLSACVLFLKS